MRLNYRVVHVQSVDVQKDTVIDGEDAVATLKRDVIELVAEGHDGGSIMIQVPAGSDYFAEGSVIPVSFGVPAPVQVKKKGAR